MILLIWLRVWGRAKASSWSQEDEPEYEDDERQTPLLDTEPKPRAQRRMSFGKEMSVKIAAKKESFRKDGEDTCLRSCSRTIKAGLFIFGKYFSRSVLQIFQWWVILLIFLWALLAGDLYEIEGEYHLIDAVFRPLLHGQPRVKPAAFDGIPDWLAFFSIYSLVALIVIYVVATVCILLQLINHVTGTVATNARRCMGGDGSAMMSMPRDTATQVLLLPMVYGFLSIRSVVCMWQSVSGKFPAPLTCTHWSVSDRREVPTSAAQIREVLVEVYDSNFALADMYEAWSLFMFARMVAGVLEPELKKKIKPQVIQAFKGLLVIDVFVFVLVASASAVIRIGLTWTKWRLGIDMCKVNPALCLFSPYLVGANWCVSSIAIYNLIVIEFRFHDLEMMKKFGPRLKFWAIKLMVLVSFWSDLAMGLLQLFLHLDADEAKILDSSFRIFVMAFVSMLNIAAWWPWNRWYHMVNARDASDKKDGNGKLTDIGVPDDVPPGTISLVKELLENFCDDLTDDKIQNIEFVNGIIDDLNEDQLSRVLSLGSQIGWVVPSKFAELQNQSGIEVRGGLFSSPAKIYEAEGLRRKALFLCGHAEQKNALKQHLRGFYPDACSMASENH